MIGETRGRAGLVLPRPPRAGVTLTLAAAALSLASCGTDGNGRLPVHRVSGTLLRGGLPASDALVTFHPLDPAAPTSLRPNGKVEADGTFRVTTYEAGDGAPAGEYAVTVFWPEPPKSPVDAPDSGPDRLKGRFLDPQKSEWRVRVAEGENALAPFDLE